MLRIYTDGTLTKTVDTISWDKSLILKLVSGKKVELPNTAQAGQLASATLYIRNEGIYPYFITKIDFPDARIKISLDKEQLEPNQISKLTLSFQVPKVITPNDVVKTGKLEIEGYYVYSTI